MTEMTDDRLLRDLAALPRPTLEAMQAAGAEMRECERVLRKGGLNVVGEVLKGQGKFFKQHHYPKGDVHDRDSQAQYSYHAHREAEHGHFHTFLRAPGMPAGVAPVAEAAALAGPRATRRWPISWRSRCTSAGCRFGCSRQTAGSPAKPGIRPPM